MKYKEIDVAELYTYYRVIISCYALLTGLRAYIFQFLFSNSEFQGLYEHGDFQSIKANG